MFETRRDAGPRPPGKGMRVAELGATRALELQLQADAWGKMHRRGGTAQGPGDSAEPARRAAAGGVKTTIGAAAPAGGQGRGKDFPR